MINNASINDLEELRDLMYRIQHEIDTYNHVSEHLPKVITSNIDKYTDRVLKKIEQYYEQD
jgi:CRISPR/Cas system-associated exonuclease Cas4 (RecB family)